jgi:hypothetical protein
MRLICQHFLIHESEEGMFCPYVKVRNMIITIIVESLKSVLNISYNDILYL